MTRYRIVQASKTSPPQVAVYLACAAQSCPAVYRLGQDRPISTLSADAAVAGWSFGPGRGQERCPDHQPDGTWKPPSGPLDPGQTIIDTPPSVAGWTELTDRERAAIATLVIEGLRRDGGA